MNEEEKIAAAVAEALKPIKASLDASYAARDAAIAENDVLKAASQAALDELIANKEASGQALAEKAKAEGDFKALHELTIAANIAKLTKTEEALREATRVSLEASTKVSELAKQNSELARDNIISVNLKGTTFVNEVAASIAVAQLAQEMVLVDSVWKHSSGATLAESIETFLHSEDNAFLLKQPTSFGAGIPRFKGKSSTTEPLTTAAILKLAQEGKLQLK